MLKSANVRVEPVAGCGNKTQPMVPNIMSALTLTLVLAAALGLESAWGRWLPASIGVRVEDEMSTDPDSNVGDGAVVRGVARVDSGVGVDV